MRKGIVNSRQGTLSGGSQGWENENEPTSSKSTLVICGGAAGRFTKQATTFPEEGN